VPFARSHGATRLHYAERGESRATSWPFLLIHGAGASAAIWMMVMARLGRVGRVIAIDLPGHGPSPPFADRPRPTLADYCNATGELAAMTGLGRSVLIGHSMGALIAIEAALAWPDKVAGLVLCAAAPRLPVSRDLMKVIDEDYAHFPAWLAERALSASAKPALRRAFIAAGVVAPQAVTRADFQAIAGADLGARLSAIRCPTVWLDGGDDAIVAERGERPGVIERLPGVGHLVPLEAPAAVARAAIELGARPGAPE
jgi:pimeloyl-ACP methyl ester carboxylesterase